jgi:hypothetical protein
MAKLRCYQISFPEEATEGMNRLAEAFITVAEASSKTATIAAPAPAPVMSKEETSVTAHTKVDWSAEPPPVRVATADEPDEPTIEEESDEVEVLVAKPFVAPTKSKRAIEDALLHHLGQESEEATSNVGTIEAIIARVELTRQLLHSWERVGKLLRVKSTKAGPKESEAYAKRLGEIATTMQTYPAFLGQPGKPGYRVVVLARLKMPLAMTRGVSDDQREELLFDWDAGRRVLLEHRKFLRRQFKSMRRRTSVGLVLHAVRSFVNDYPWPTLIGVLVLVMVVVSSGLMWLWR